MKTLKLEVLVAVQVTGDGGMDQIRKNIFGIQLGGGPKGFHVQLDGSCERKKIKNDSRFVFEGEREIVCPNIVYLFGVGKLATAKLGELPNSVLTHLGIKSLYCLCI